MNLEVNPIAKIGEDWLSYEKGEGLFEILKKQNTDIFIGRELIRRRGGGLENLDQKQKI